MGSVKVSFSGGGDPPKSLGLGDSGLSVITAISGGRLPYTGTSGNWPYLSEPHCAAEKRIIPPCRLVQEDGGGKGRCQEINVGAICLLS